VLVNPAALVRLTVCQNADHESSPQRAHRTELAVFTQCSAANPAAAFAFCFHKLGSGLAPGILVYLGADRLHQMACASGLREKGPEGLGAFQPVKRQSLRDVLAIAAQHAELSRESASRNGTPIHPLRLVA
jgi:hypothetical protein